MTDTALKLMLSNLRDFLLDHCRLIVESKKELENLEMELRHIQAFLEHSVEKLGNDEPTKLLQKNIRDVVYEAEDFVDSFIVMAMGKNSTNSFRRLWTPSIDLRALCVKVEEVNQNVQKAMTDFATLSVDDEDNYDKLEQKRQKNVVGFKDVAEDLVGRLTKDTDYFDVVSLIGMKGIGKTTLAWKIFNDPKTSYKFPVRVWLRISKELSQKDIFLAILEEFITINEKVRQKDSTEIARVVASYLDIASFLIVFDDVRNQDDWERLCIALPHNNPKGKILITSRNEGVGAHASHPRPPTKLRFFTQEESWELLCLEALCRLDCPPELENAGQQIARNCGGLPLAIVIIGGILGPKSRGQDMIAMGKAWIKVSKDINECLTENEKDLEDRIKRFISLSYHTLPSHLRECFLYLGIFPEDCEISASKLIRLWIAEGFIQHKNYYSLEECGEKYLEDLVIANLVQIQKFKPNGKVKTLRIHDAMRNFCIAEVENENENENFLQEIKFDIKAGFTPSLSNLDKYRRLSIHSNIMDFFSEKPSGQGHRVRSFVCISKDECTLPRRNITDFLAGSKLLRVLDVKPIRLSTISKNMYRLVHARYISMSLGSSTLPSKFIHLSYTQTLIVNTTSHTLEIKADILKLVHLRHFKTNASAILPKPSKDGKCGAPELQTLGTVSVESCTAELFERACNLKNLGIRGQLALFLAGKVGSIDSVGKMKYLEQLKLVNDVHPRPASEGQLRSLPGLYQFPSQLKSLTLRATYLHWNFMSTLSLLENLRVLKLKDKAFMGNTWKTDDGGFRRLKFLHIEDTDLTVWKISSHQFPSLRALVLKKCDKLIGIPIELADVASLQMLELHFCRSATTSAKRIREVKRRRMKTEAEGSTFRLSIFPATY